MILANKFFERSLRSNNQKQVESRREKKKLEKESIVSKSNVEDPRKTELENKKRIARREEIKYYKIKRQKKLRQMRREEK